MNKKTRVQSDVEIANANTKIWEDLPKTEVPWWGHAWRGSRRLGQGLLRDPAELESKDIWKAFIEVLNREPVGLGWYLTFWTKIDDTVLSWSESLATYQYNKITTGFWTYPTWIWLEKHVFLHNMERHGEVFTLHWEIGKLGKWGERHVVIAMSVLTAGHLEMTQPALARRVDTMWLSSRLLNQIVQLECDGITWNSMRFHMIPLCVERLLLDNSSESSVTLSNLWCSCMPATGSHHPLAI